MTFIQRVQAFFSCKSVDRLELDVGLSDDEGRWYRLQLPHLKTWRPSSAAHRLFPQTCHYGSGDGAFVWPDPTSGPDIGLWFSADLASAAYNALSQGGAAPVVYTAKVDAAQVAVFDSEMALSDFAGRPERLPQARFVLLHEGFDAVYLEREKKVTALDPRCLQLQAVQPAGLVIQAYPEQHYQFLQTHRRIQQVEAALLKPPRLMCA
jgi:hypothetical protein